MYETGELLELLRRRPSFRKNEGFLCLWNINRKKMVPVIGFELMTYRFTILNHFQVDNNCRENLDFLFILLIKINLDAPVKSLHVHPKGYFARDCHFKGFPNLRSVHLNVSKESCNFTYKAVALPLS